MADSSRLELVEDRVAALQTASAQGFGEISAEIKHLRQLVESTIAKPPPPPPLWQVLVGVGSCLTGGATLVIAIVLVLK